MRNKGMQLGKLGMTWVATTFPQVVLDELRILLEATGADVYKPALVPVDYETFETSKATYTNIFMQERGAKQGDTIYLPALELEQFIS